MCLGLLLGALDDVIKTVGRAIMREREKNYGPDPGEREYNNREKERIRLLDIQSQPVVQPINKYSLLLISNCIS